MNDVIENMTSYPHLVDIKLAEMCSNRRNCDLVNIILRERMHVMNNKVYSEVTKGKMKAFMRYSMF